MKTPNVPRNIFYSNAILKGGMYIAGGVNNSPCFIQIKLFPHFYLDSGRSIKDWRQEKT